MPRAPRIASTSWPSQSNLIETRVMAWRSEPFFESDPSIVILRRFTEQLGLGDHISGNRRRHKFQAGPGSQERLRL
jgi:hypothetical protein